MADTHAHAPHQHKTEATLLEHEVTCSYLPQYVPTCNNSTSPKPP